MQKDPRQLRIAYVSALDPHDKLAWSGSHYSIFSTLKKNFGTVDVLGPFTPAVPVFIGKVRHFLAKLFGKRYDFRRSKAVSEAYAKYFDAKLATGGYDLIVAPAAVAEVARLKTSIPIVSIADATIKSSLNYHKALSNVIDSSLRESEETEGLALEKSSLCVFTTQWAAASATTGYHIPKEKIAVIPFGANFEEEPAREKTLPKKKGEVCQLLFIGVNWENKGGPIAVNALQKLLAWGVDAELTICGCIPPEEFRNEKITVIPFLNKSVKSEREKLYALYEQAAFFILPTRFEAYGLVFCEASAYGVPSLATRTGGVPGVISEGENGFLFDSSDTGEGYARKILELWNDENQYQQLVSNSRKKYEGQLNWNAFGRTLLVALEKGNII